LTSLIGLHNFVLKYGIYYKKSIVKLPTKGMKNRLLHWDENLPDKNKIEERKTLFLKIKIKFQSI